MSESPQLVLLVDNDADLLGLLAEKFRDAGFLVKTANDGSTATYQIDNTPFKAIITDIKLPNMNGMQVASNARRSKLNQKTPIIIVSGYMTDEVRQKAEALGIEAQFPKPFDPDVIVQKAKELMATVATKPVAAASKHPYDAKILKAILMAVGEVMTFYLGEGFKVQKPALNAPKERNTFATALISLTGNGIQGSVALCFEREFLAALSDAINKGFKVENTDSVLSDVAGETVNQVCGKVKINLAKVGLKIMIGLPEVITGQGHSVSHKTSAAVLSVPCTHNGKRCKAEFCFTRSMVEDPEPPKVEEPAVTDILMF